MPRIDRRDWRRLEGQPPLREWVKGPSHWLAVTHSLKLRHHRHTSYISLVGLLLVAGIGMAYATAQVGAAGTSTPEAPSIVSPASGTTQASSVVNVVGSCQPQDFVFLSRNDIFAGSTACRDGGRYELEISIFPGVNSIAAKTISAGGTASAMTDAVNVTYTADAYDSLGAMLLRSGTAVHLAKSKTETSRSAVLMGGTPPYAVKWQFGDGTTQSSVMPAEGELMARHSYARAGDYQVMLQVDDATGRSVRLGLATRAVSENTAANSAQSTILKGLLSAWPVYVALLILVAAFVLGEIRETFKLRRLNRERRENGLIV